MTIEERDFSVAEFLYRELLKQPGRSLSGLYEPCLKKLQECSDVTIDRTEFDKFCVHPWDPYIPDRARVLFLGSFPPPDSRWSMDFYYPNFINDMWRILGLVFFQDKSHFIVPGQKTFDLDKIKTFCTEAGIALYDAAYMVKREKGNASDKFLKILIPSDIKSILSAMPECRTLVCTGEKSAEMIASLLECAVPSVGESVLCGELRFFRMPSTSRAYPLSIDKKAGFYRRVFQYIE